MELFDLGGRAFRSRLKQALPAWQAEGLLSADGARQLSTRYQLAEDGSSVTVTAIYLIGALLVGGGLLSFVAWNWGALPAGVKLGLVGSAMVASHLAGLRLWRGTRKPRLGHALTLLGTLVFGANIGLVAQVFHASGTWHLGFGGWALGALAAAIALRSVPQLVLAQVLGLVWAIGFVWEHEALGVPVALGTAAVSGGVAWALRSRAGVFLAAAMSSALALLSAGQAAGESGVFLCTVGLACLLLAAPFAFGAGSEGERRLLPASFLGLAGVVVIAFGFSFHEVAHDLGRSLARDPGGWPFGLVPLVAAAGCLGARLLADPASVLARPARLAALAAGPLLLAGVFDPDPGIVLAIAANVALVAVASTAIASSVRGLERGPFWGGAGTLGLLVVSRFLEFETELWLKALVFVACGLATIAVGAAFERRVRKEARHAS